MAGELTIPILPCRLLDDVLAFYEALGFAVTYRQARPNPYAVVRREDIQLHFCQPHGFDPERSYASAIVAVPDPDALYRSFADGLRAVYGKLPRAGIPRILRPREKLGTVAGFSVVDPGGNWLRIYRRGDSEHALEKVTGLAPVLRSAARQGDALGDDATALDARGRAGPPCRRAGGRAPAGAGLPGGARGPPGRPGGESWPRSPRSVRSTSTTRRPCSLAWFGGGHRRRRHEERRSGRLLLHALGHDPFGRVRPDGAAGRVQV